MNYNLSAIRDDAVFDLEQSIFSVDLNSGWKKFRAESRTICDNFLTLAAASLLADAKPDMFFLNLCRSAENWRRYLRVSKSHFSTRPSLIYSTPLCAAIIAGDQKLLASIAPAMPSQFVPGEEFAHQFHGCWLQLSLALNHCQPNEKIVEHILALEASEKEPQQAPLAKALLGMDELTEADFWNQFDTWLYQHEEQTEAWAKRTTGVVISEFAAKRFIWFEGLVWLTFAKQRGFTPPSSGYLYCPDEALDTMPTAYTGDWVMLSNMAI